MKDLVSIVVPIYNSEKYLKRCINSILNQTYKNFELILVDDGSKDKSYDICCNFAETDKRIIVKQKINGGVSSARNLGISSARGEIILFVDADDTVNSKYVEFLVKPLLDSQYDVSICGFLDVFSKKTLKRININNISIEGDIVKDFYKIFALIFSTCNIAYKKQIIKNNNLLFDENMRQGEDIFFNIQYFNYVDRAFLIKKYLYNYFHRKNDSLNQKAYYNDFENYLLRLNILKELLNKRNFFNNNKVLADYAIAGVCKFGVLNDGQNSYYNFKNRCKLIMCNLEKKVLFIDKKKQIFWFLLWENKLILYLLLLIKKVALIK